MLGGGNIDKNSWDDKVKIEKVVKRKYSFFNLSSVYVALVSIFLYLLLAQVVPTFYYGALFIFIPYVIFLLIKLVFALLIDRIDLKNEMFCDICGLVFYLPFAFINFMPQGTTLYTYLILTPVLISIFSLWYHINNRKVSLFLVLYILASALLISGYVYAYKKYYILEYSLYVLIMLMVISMTIFDILTRKEKPIIYIVNIVLVETIYLLKFFLSNGAIDSSSFRSIIIGGSICLVLILALLSSNKPVSYLKNFTAIYIILNLLDSFIKKGIYFAKYGRWSINYMMIFMTSLILIYLFLVKFLDEKKEEINKNNLKSFSLLVLLFVFVGSAFSVKAMATDVWMVNKNGVEITNQGKEKLLTVGYTPKELKNLTKAEYDNVINMNISSILKEETLLKTTTSLNEKGELISIDEVVGKNEVNKALAMKKPGGNNLLPNYIDPNLSFEQEPIGGGGGYPSKENTSEEAYKRLTIHVTYYTNEGSTGTFFVKETLEWLTNPKSRRTDYLGISTDGSFLLKKLDENAEKLDFNLKLSYDYHKEKIYSESSYKSPIIEDSEVVESFDINNANYKLEGSNLLVGCKLPEDFYYDYTDEYDLRIIENTYTNFVISLTANFVPLYQNPIEGRFRGLHLHEKNETYVTIDKITLRPEFPYFSISVSLDSNLAFDDVSVNVALDL